MTKYSYTLCYSQEHFICFQQFATNAPYIIGICESQSTYIYRVPQCMPLVGIGTLPTPFSTASVPLPPETGGMGHTSLRVGGWGESHFRRGAYTVVLFICTYFVCTGLYIPYSVYRGGGGDVVMWRAYTGLNRGPQTPAAMSFYWSIFRKSRHLEFVIFIDIWSMIKPKVDTARLSGRRPGV